LDINQVFGGYKLQIQEALEFIRFGLGLSLDSSLQQSLQAFQAKLPKGLLFYGPQGVGKTLLMKLLVSTVGCKVLELNYSVLGMR
jgi:ATP-dependent 26S proteasome regulatory subunit